MTPTYAATAARHRQLFVPVRPEAAFRPGAARPEAAPRPEAPRAESVPLAPPVPQDPPIYRALQRTWAERGRTLPGHPDPEWVRLVAPQVRPGQFGGTADPLAGDAH